MVSIRQDAPALRDFWKWSHQAVQLFPQLPQHAEAGLADGIICQAEISRNLHAGLALQSGADEALRGCLAEIAAHQVQSTMNDLPPQLAVNFALQVRE